MIYPEGYHILSEETRITEHVHVQWAPRSNRWSKISANSPFLGKTPNQVELTMGRRINFGLPILEGERFQAIVLDQQALRTAIMNKTRQGEYIVALYRLIHPDFDRIKMFNAYPVCTKETWCAIAQVCKEKDAEINKTRDFSNQTLEGGAWMNSGFSCYSVPDGLRHMMVIPCADSDLVYAPTLEEVAEKI